MALIDTVTKKLLNDPKEPRRQNKYEQILSELDTKSAKLEAEISQLKAKGLGQKAEDINRLWQLNSELEDVSLKKVQFRNVDALTRQIVARGEHELSRTLGTYTPVVLGAGSSAGVIAVVESSVEGVGWLASKGAEKVTKPGHAFHAQALHQAEVYKAHWKTATFMPVFNALRFASTDERAKANASQALTVLKAMPSAMLLEALKQPLELSQKAVIQQILKMRRS